MRNFNSKRVESNVGKSKIKAGYHHFLLLPQYLHKPYSTELLKLGIVCGNG